MFERDEPIERVHFLECGVGSVVAEQGGGEQIEVGIYGREGLSATAVLLGAGQSPLSSMIQIGHAVSLSIASDRLLEACHASRSLHDALLRYVQSMEVQAALTAVSNARYTLTERLARWLLMCHDRVDDDQLELTHRFMSMMLAVRRSGVTVTIHTLEAAGSIKSARGLITIADRSRLEEIAGNAYGQAEAEYRRLVAPFGKGRGAA
jgi:CRP-like cAMP-binding protein